ncbi:hypothetical protein M9H77_35781 [Catharanthus roseus]|uniref:Uncharacterized protein n=1 Tax=Catharanthus roseus TaxID=4058 RepID=A0ACB9ZPZ4_CATRO|nr:hypothetical protein M9H77_35781 [Catharanthus roseus]
MLKLENGSWNSSGEEEENDGNGDVEEVDVTENTVKKKKKEVVHEMGLWQLQLKDPLLVLGSDILHVILSWLEARSAAQSLNVSRGWQGVASTDRLWSPKCEELWQGKVHIPRLSRTQGLSKLHVYSLSVMDGRRTRITRDDLCDHAWEFHFREAAPIYWRDLDPYWKGTGQLMRRYFHPDGSQTADVGDKVWGGHEACYTVVAVLYANGNVREHYVRINRWSRLAVSRNLDWGWEMSNAISCYSSIPDPEKEDGTGPLLLLKHG